MTNFLSLISRVHEKGNQFIIDELRKNGAVGLVPSHGDILYCLYTNGEMTMKDIADCIHRTKPTVTVLVNKLEKLGYLKRKSSQTDNRYTYISLTPKGENFKVVFEKISDDLEKMLCKNLSETEIREIEEILKKI